MLFVTLDNSKIEVFETDCFDVVTIEHGHPRYVKHVLARIHVLFTLFGCWARGGGSPKGLVHNLLVQFFSLDYSKIAVTS